MTFPFRPGPDPWMGALRVLWAIARPIGVGAAVWLVFQLPMPILDDWLPVKHVAGAVLAVTSAGATLYNTLFYSRFRP